MRRQGGKAMRRALLAGLVLLLGACAARPVPPAVPPVPVQANAGAADPVRQAVLSAAYVFADTSRIAGRPADAARAVAQLEWMAVGLPREQVWIGAVPTLFFALDRATAEVRAVLGIAPQATPAAVVQGFGEAAAALDRGAPDAAAAALAPVATGGGAALAARLQALPRLPLAAAATNQAQQEMQRLMMSDPE
jgi:hypothetical protein